MAIAFDRAEKPLRQLRKSLRRLDGNPEPDAVHKLRTRARQVEAIATALPHPSEKHARRLGKSIRALRKAAGHVRDMDVLAALARALPQEQYGESIAALLAYLESSRKKHAAELLETVDRHRHQAREHLKQYAGHLAERKESAALAREAEQQIHAAAACHAAELSNWPPLAARNLHAFRLKVKELRSVLQLLSAADRALVDDLGLVKDKIGEWHDWLQLATTAADALAAHPSDRLQHRALLRLIRQTGKQKLREALTSANAFRELYLQQAFKKPPARERRSPASIKARRNPAA